jgi:hypothetical protein
MNKFFYILLFCFIGLVSACDADKNSDVAKAYDLEMALEARNYDKIISKLQNDDVENTDYTSLSQREKYLLQMAWIGKSGFNIIDIVDQFFEDDADTTEILFSSVSAGASNADRDALSSKKAYYKLVNIIDNSDNNPNHFDLDINTAAGIASALKAIIIISELAADLANVVSIPGVDLDNISFDKNAPNYVGNVFDNATDDQLKEQIDNMNIDEIIETINDLSKAVDNLDTVTVSDEEDAAKVQEKFNDFLNKIADCSFNTCVVTKESVEKYVNETFRQKGE